MNIVDVMETDDDNDMIEAEVEANTTTEAVTTTTTTTTTTNHTKRHVGRAARRRRRKWKEICRIEQTLLEDEGEEEVFGVSKMNRKSCITTATAAAVVLPADRDHIWPSVLALRITSGWDTSADAIALTSQLGYTPGNAIRIVSRVKDVPMLLQPHLIMSHNCNSPVVVQLYPMVWRDPHEGGKSGGRLFKSRKRQRCWPSPPQSVASTSVSTISTTATTTTAATFLLEKEANMLMEPFPTIYWLTHPLLRCLVSKLEWEGYGIQLEQRLRNDTASLAMMNQAHMAYGQERWNLLSPSDIEVIQCLKWQSAFSISRGVAGISNKNFGAVKCLHAHLAHYLSKGVGSGSNVVGKWVWEEIIDRNERLQKW
jgi:hypothetical protein